MLCLVSSQSSDKVRLIVRPTLLILVVPNFPIETDNSDFVCSKPAVAVREYFLARHVMKTPDID